MQRIKSKREYHEASNREGGERIHRFSTSAISIKCPVMLFMALNLVALLVLLCQHVPAPHFRHQQTVFVITPTYRRPTQLVDLMKLTSTLRLVPNVHWVLVEDAPNTTDRIEHFLSDRISSLRHSHLAIRDLENSHNICYRGNAQRNLGLDFVEKIAQDSDIIYLADDDNTYDPALFGEILKTKVISTFAVAFVGHARYQRCIVDPVSGRITGFMTRWANSRTFMLDMASFAFSGRALRASGARFHSSVSCGVIEEKFIQQFISSAAQLEPLGRNCTRIMAWHVRTQDPQGDGMVPWNYMSVPTVNGSTLEPDPLFDEIEV